MAGGDDKDSSVFGTISEAEHKKVVNWYKVKKDSSKCLLCNKRKKLQFHHIVPTDKVETIAHMVFRYYDLETVKSEMKKCVCLCQACHIAVHQGKVSITTQKNSPHKRCKHRGGRGRKKR